MGRRSLGRIHEDEQLEQLPVSRIKTIMKSSPEVEGIRKEALFLVNKATEFFIQFLASTAYVRANGAWELDYNYLSEIVQGDKRLTFMSDLFPKRITYKEYKDLVEKKRKNAEKVKNDKNRGAAQKLLAVETTELPPSKGSKMKATAQKKARNSKKLPKQVKLDTPEVAPGPNKDSNKNDGINTKKPNSESLGCSGDTGLCDESDNSENDCNVGEEEKDRIDDNNEENIDDTIGDQTFCEKMQE